MTKNSLKMISAIVLAGILLVLDSNTAYADCEPNYGGGETCITNKRFEIEKGVRLEGDSSWRDKVYIDLTDEDEADKKIEFRIRIKNRSKSEDEDADLSFDNMKMEDEFPDELFRTGGSGLTEYWDDFDAGEVEEFIIEVDLESDERGREEDFEKCVVNKASVYWDGDFEGSDTAVVCYGNREVTELPETGAMSTLAITGFGLIALGTLIKKSKDILVR
ncbi:hypothetical protein OAL67_01250 [bacterium]|nr:hypothetical protein [bacterium]